MFEEALSAVHTGDRARARDLLTRLLKNGKENAEYWVWMSAVVDTAKERSFCLKEAHRIDPLHPAARRGLLLIGALPPEEVAAIPASLQKRNWQAKILYGEGLGQEPARMLPRQQLALMGLALVVVLGLVGFAIFGVEQRLHRPQNAPILFLPTETRVLAAAATPTATRTVSGSPTALWMVLASTYTPTPLFVNTAHPVNEAYSIGKRAFLRSEYAEAAKYFVQVATAEPGSADMLYYLGESNRLQGNLDQAQQVYAQAIQLNPNFAPLYLGRALVCLAQQPKSITACEPDLQAAVEKNPTYGEAYLNLAGVQIQSEKYDQAAQNLALAEKYLPDSPLVPLYRAQINLAQNEPDKALENAQKANQLDVTLLDAYRLMGAARQAQADDLGSLEPLSIYAAYVPDDAQVWAWLAKAQLAKGDRQAAVRALDQALTLDNRQPDAYLMRAQLGLENGNPEQALDDFKATLRYNSTSFEASLGVGKALLDLQYPGDAYVQFERTRALAKQALQTAEVLYWRAQSLERLGEVVAALRDYKALVDMPEGSVRAEWVHFAKAHIAALATATPTPKVTAPAATGTVTRTPQPTRTPLPVQTRQPTGTRLP